MLRVAYDGSWFDNLDDTLVWDSPLRLDDSTSAPGRGRMSLWPTNSAQTVSAAGYTQARAPHAGHRVHLVRRAGTTTSRCSRSRSTRRCRRLRCRGRRPKPRRTSSRPTSISCRVRRPTGGSARGCGATTTTTRCRHDAITQFINYDTSVDDVVDRRAGALRAQPHHVRRRRDLERAGAAGAHRRLHAQQHRLRLPHLREQRRERAAPRGRRGRLAVG